MKQGKLVCGVGINDAGYVVKISKTIGYRANGRAIQKTEWRCPFYDKWAAMLKRSYSAQLHKDNPTYVGCSVVPEWHRFSTFKTWMEEQDWEGNQLDKDLLLHGNKVYGPEHCIFVSPLVNSFLVEGTANRGEWPIGVTYFRPRRKFQAACSNPFTGEVEYLGRFSCPNEAHQAWLKRKRELAQELAALQTDARIAKALLDRYAGDVYTTLHE